MDDKTSPYLSSYRPAVGLPGLQEYLQVGCPARSLRCNMWGLIPASLFLVSFFIALKWTLVVLGLRTLYSIWDDMEDSKREIVLRQVVEILLELASQSFDKLGMLFQQESHNDLKDAWYIGSSIPGPDNGFVQTSLSKIFTSIVGYWLVYANTKLKIIYQYTVRRAGKIFDYDFTWFLRSLIPTVWPLPWIMQVSRFVLATFTPKTFWSSKPILLPAFLVISIGNFLSPTEHPLSQHIPFS